jgi:hypothetical protein
VDPRRSADSRYSIHSQYGLVFVFLSRYLEKENMYVVLVSRRRLRPQSPSESDIALEKPMSAGSDDYSLMRSAVYTTLTNPSILKQLGFAAYQEFVPKLVQTVHNNLQDTGKVDEQMMKHQQEQLTPRGSGHKSKRKQMLPQLKR